MEHLSWKCLVLITIALCSIAMAGPVPENTIDELSPVTVEENSANDVDREKRKIFGPDVKLGVKNAVLGYVFSDDDENSDGGHSLVRVTRATPVLPPGVTDDTPDFRRDGVMLDVNPQLASQSLSLVLNLSTVFGEWIMNSARRYARLVQYFKPVLGKALTVKGLYPPPKTTTEAYNFDDDSQARAAESKTTDKASTNDSNDI